MDRHGRMEESTGLVHGARGRETAGQPIDPAEVPLPTTSPAAMTARDSRPPEAPLPGERTDGEVIRACQAGEEDAFAELVQRYHGRAYWVAYGLLGRDEEAQDVIQDAFLRVYRALDRFDFNQNFYTWLYRIVVNLAIDRIRKASKARSVALDDVGEPASPISLDESPGRRLEVIETRREVRAVLSRLPEKYRTVMVLRELNGLSCKEIAGIVRSSHATVRWRLHMARKYFKEEWERREEQADRGEAQR